MLYRFHDALHSLALKAAGYPQPLPIDVTLTVPITKVKDEERMIYGWASVIEKNGRPVVDWHDDVIEEAELKEAARAFMVNSRRGLVMHKGEPAMQIVESLVFTADVQKALGITLGKVGWFVGAQVFSNMAWARVKSGELRALSIGLRARRVSLQT